MQRRSSQSKKTYAVAKRKAEKIQACGDSSPDLCDTGAAL